MVKILGIADVIEKHKKLFITSVVIILAAVYNVPGIRNSVLHAAGVATYNEQLDMAEKLSTIETALTTIEGTVTSLHYDLLILLLTNETLPIEARMKAYDDYAKLGYNSWVRLYYDEVLAPQAGSSLRGRYGR